MYLLDYSLDNLSLMALTVATGFVVDDAVVVLENIQRHVEAGMGAVEAALLGAREVGFTVLSISFSLIAVFVPILAMGGLVGRLFHEFAVVLSASILVSLLISLTTTPMICSLLLRSKARKAGMTDLAHRPLSARELVAAADGVFGFFLRAYARSLNWSLRHGRVILLVLLATVSLNIYLYTVVPKGFFPQQDTGRLIGIIQADQSISFQAMRVKLAAYMEIIGKDPGVENVIGFTGGGQRNSAQIFVALKDRKQRSGSADDVINRLRRPLARVPGASMFLQSVQDLRVGGRQGNAQYQYTLQGESLDELRQWSPRILTMPTRSTR